MSLSRSLDLLQILIALVVAILFLQGRGAHGVFLVTVALLPIARTAVSRSYRHRVASFGRAHWAELRRYTRHEPGPLPWRSALWLVVLPSCALFLVNGRSISSFDNLPVNLSAVSIVTEGNFELGEFFGLKQGACDPKGMPYSVRCFGGGAYSMYPAGMLAFSLPAFTVARVTGAKLAQGLVQWRIAKVVSSLLTAVSIALLFLLALRLAGEGAAVWMAVLLATGSALLSTAAQGLWTQTGVVAWLTILLWLEIEESARAWRYATWAQGIAVGGMMACRLTAITLVVPFFAYVLSRSRKRAALLALASALGYLPWALYYWAIYHTPLGPQMQVGASFVWGEHFLENLAGIVFSPGRGLLVYQPWICLLIFAAFSTSRISARAWAALAAITLQIVLVSLWPSWPGGHCWGSRLMTETIPLFALLTLPALDRLRRKKALVALAGLSFFVQITGVVGKGIRWNDDPSTKTRPEIERMWDWGDPPFLYALSARKGPDREQ